MVSFSGALAAQKNRPPTDVTTVLPTRPAGVAFFLSLPFPSLSFLSFDSLYTLIII